MDDPENMEALLRADSVLFYRCNPYIKGQIAVALQNVGKRVLGVGDGSNDSELLKLSDVGVGLMTRGESAILAKCDFALPSFRSICRLILVHGHLSLHRSMIAVHFSFYKGFLFALVEALYQFWTDFSGQPLFDSLALGTYNMLWTSIPMISIIFERDISDNFLLRLSNLYSQLRSSLNVGRNGSWFISAVYQSVSTILVTWMLTGESFLDRRTGRDMGVQFLSINIFIAIVLMTCIFLIMQLNMLTYYSIVCIVGMLLGMIAVFTVFQTPVVNLRFWIGFYGESFNAIQTLTIIITVVLMGIVPTHVAMLLWNEKYHEQVIQVIEAETAAAITDEPVFYDPPTSERVVRKNALEEIASRGGRGEAVEKPSPRR
jgi:magnesium-transporting ATPase (P-type)